MSFFCNSCSIINNLKITNKLYYVAMYLESSEKINTNDNSIIFTINANANAISISNNTSSTSASLTATTNTTNGIGNFYVSLLENITNLIYQQFSSLPGFENCNSDTSLTSYYPLNTINLVSTEIMKFKFDIINLKVSRQGGQTIDAFIEYQYINYFENFNYQNLRDYIIQVLTNPIDIDTYWENLAIYIAQNALQKFKKIIGIKINLVVLSNPDGDISEPGDHGPTYTYGIFI